MEGHEPESPVVWPYVVGTAVGVPLVGWVLIATRHVGGPQWAAFWTGLPQPAAFGFLWAVVLGALCKGAGAGGSLVLGGIAANIAFFGLVDADPLLAGGAFLAVIFFVPVALELAFPEPQCPECKALHPLQPTAEHRVQGFPLPEETRWKCEACGYLEWRYDVQDTGDF